MKAFRGEILSVPEDPAVAGAEAIRHYQDGLLVVEDGAVLACGPHAELAGRFAEAEVTPLEGLIVPGFVDAHVHYPQIGSIASHGEQLMQWLERHIFPAEKAFADRTHADAAAAFFLDAGKLALAAWDATSALAAFTRTLELGGDEDRDKKREAVAGRERALFHLGDHAARAKKMKLEVVGAEIIDIANFQGLERRQATPGFRALTAEKEGIAASRVAAKAVSLGRATKPIRAA